MDGTPENDLPVGFNLYVFSLSLSLYVCLFLDGSGQDS